MSDLNITELWFKRAVPTPTAKNMDTQLGCHFEEFGEMLECISFGKDDDIREWLLERIKSVAIHLKCGAITHTVTDRKELLDALCDQIVTATGVGHMHSLKVAEGMNRVNASNFSKFDTNGMPIFDANGKIAKNKDTYKPADLEGLY